MSDIGRLVAHSGLIGVAFLDWRLRKHENSVTDFLADPSLSGLGQLTGGNTMSAAESVAYCAPGSIRPSWFHEHQSGSCDQPVLALGLRLRPSRNCANCLQPSQDLVVIALPRRGRRQELDRPRDAFNGNGGSPDEWPRPTRKAQWRTKQ